MKIRCDNIAREYISIKLKSVTLIAIFGGWKMSKNNLILFLYIVMKSERSNV